MPDKASTMSLTIDEISFNCHRQLQRYNFFFKKFQYFYISQDNNSSSWKEGIHVFYTLHVNYIYDETKMRPQILGTTEDTECLSYLLYSGKAMHRF